MSLDWIGWDSLSYDEILWGNRAAAFALGCWFVLAVQTGVGFVAQRLPARKRKKAQRKGRR